MRPNRLLVPLGILIFLALSLIGHGQAVAGANLNYGAVPLAVTWPAFTVGAVSTNPFPIGGLNYFQLVAIPNGTVASCAVSIDGATQMGGSFSTGSVTSAGTIGSCASPLLYTSVTAVTPSLQGRLTVTITGTGSVTIILLGYIANPATAGGGSTTSTQGPPGALSAGWPIVGGAPAEASASWTSATGGNATLAMTLGGMNSVFVWLSQGSTITGGVVTFEVSDTAGFTNAYPIQCTQANSFLTASTYTLVQSTNQPWDCDVAGAIAFRVRLSTVITGSGTVTVGITANAMPSVGDVSVGGTLNTQPSGFASIVGNQQAVTASAVALPSNSVHGFCVKAVPTNTITVYLGPSGVTTSTGYPLAAGDSICYQASNTNLAFVIAGSTGASIAFSGN